MPTGLFKWKDIYRIVQKMESPEIDEESDDKNAEEFFSLWGVGITCMNYFNQSQYSWVKNRKFGEWFPVFFDASKQAMIQQIRWLFNMKSFFRIK